MLFGLQLLDRLGSVAAVDSSAVVDSSAAVAARTQSFDKLLDLPGESPANTDASQH